MAYRILVVDDDRSIIKMMGNCEQINTPEQCINQTVPG